LRPGVKEIPLPQDGEKKKMSVKKSRRKFSAEFKSKVAFEAMQEKSTLSELSKRYEVHPNMITQWKKSLKENGFKVFEDAHPEKDDRDKLIESLYKEIGSLTMDVNFLKKKLGSYL
jgi:transposase-like protein